MSSGKKVIFVCIPFWLYLYTKSAGFTYTNKIFNYVLITFKPDQTIPIVPITWYYIYYYLQQRVSILYRPILRIGKRIAAYYGYIIILSYNIIIQVTWKYSFRTSWARTAVPTWNFNVFTYTYDINHVYGCTWVMVTNFTHASVALA